MNIDNQNEFWNRVAGIKTFTHAINFDLFEKFVNLDSYILDYGCGYGRVVKQIVNLGFKNIIGFDTSEELIKRGKSENKLPIYHIENPVDLPIEDNSVDCILLFAVLTCVPSNNGQKALIKLLCSKLVKGGILYISDYYLQENREEVKKYECLNDDDDNFGVFTLEEGVTFRHHTKEWITKLISDFTVLTENEIQVQTMNRHTANAFQIICKK